MGYTPFTEAVLGLIKKVPYGKIATYGLIAKLAGSPRGARQVVRILHSLSKKENLPWHRIVNSKGEIGFRDIESRNNQIYLLKSEGIVINKNKIDLSKYLWNGRN